MKTTVVLTNEVTEIQRVKDAIVACGQTRELAAEIVHDVNVALEEVVSNIIFYGYEDTCEHQIEVHIEVSDEALAVEIYDDGKAFNPVEAPDPDLEDPFEDRKIGGMGIYLARALMNDIAYRREQGKNVLFMKKYIHPPTGEKKTQ